MRAYRLAALQVENLGTEVADLAAGGRLREVSGVGPAIAGKLEELVTTGRLGYLERLQEEVPVSLLEICALTDTLILDEDGVYDPAHFNDRLLLGLKGTMSEAELHVLRARVQGGILNKARRGELDLRCL